LCWFVHGEPYVPYETMLKRIVDLISSSSSIHKVIDDNSNCYRTMVMNAMRINHGYSNEGSCVDEELNVDATKLFKLLKDSDEPLWDRCINHSKLLFITRVFPIKSDYGLSEASYNSTIELEKSISTEGNRLKENLYAAKPMMKPLDLGYKKN